MTEEVVDEGSGDGTVVREWTWLYWTYAIVDSDIERYVEIWGHMRGWDSYVRITWGGWKTRVWLYVLLLALMTAGWLFLSAMFLSTGDTLLPLVIILWLSYTPFALMTYVMAANTFRPIDQ